MMGSYEQFVARKLGITARRGLDVEPRDLGMFPHQLDLTRWALRRGAAAIFADTGLGKTRMEVAWAEAVYRATGRDVIILAPLAVAEQTVEEAASVGVTVRHARDGADVAPGITITNYDRLHRFDTSRFGAVVLDESSIIKHHDAKTLTVLMGAFRDTPYKLCATATPAPNDWTELGTHAEFLGVRSRAEMLAEFFVHDGVDTSVWRLKGHARHAFWEWVASWGAMVRNPEDLGHDGSMYVLPPMHVHQHSLPSQHDLLTMGLFVTEAQTLMDRRAARRGSIVDRVRACADIVNADHEPWVVWCDLNAEGDALTASIPDAIQIAGADSIEEKDSVSQATVSLAGNLPALPPGFGPWGLFIPELPPLSVQIAEAAEYAKRLAENMEREARARIRGAAYKSRCDKGTVKRQSTPGLMLAVIRQYPGLHASEIFKLAGLPGSSSRSGHALSTMLARGLIERRPCPLGLRGGVYFARRTQA